MGARMHDGELNLKEQEKKTKILQWMKYLIVGEEIIGSTIKCQVNNGDGFMSQGGEQLLSFYNRWSMAINTTK